MASPGQKLGTCGHLMAGFDKHVHCTRSTDKTKGTDPCVNKEDLPNCDILTSEAVTVHAFLPKEKNVKTVMADKPTTSEKSEDASDTLVDPSLVSVIGVATTDKKAVKSPERASSREKSKKKHSPKKSSTDVKLEAFDQKSFDPFSHLEAFLLSKSLEKPSLEPTFQTMKM